MSPGRCLAPPPPAALPSLVTVLLLLLGGAGPPLARALPFPSASPADALGDADAEMDSDATQRVLGSSVVTSVSVIMDLGNGTKVLTEPGPMPRPGERIPAVASPASLMHPDRYEFYTFDEAGDLVKRYMTLPQIQSMIAGGDGSPVGGGLPLQPLGEGRVPAVDALDAPAAPPAPPGVVVADHQGAPTALGVREVVDRVQNVLRSELEANKNKVPTPGASPPTAPLAEEPGDSSGAWSVLLPAMMGSAVETASPSNLVAVTTPTPVATNATTERATTTPAPTTPQQDEDAPQPTTFKSIPSEAPTTEAAPPKPAVTEVPTTIKPAEASTLKQVPNQESNPEIVTETSMSTSFSSNLSGSSESDESPESSEDVSLSTSGSLASESEESQEGSTEANPAPPDTQSPQDNAALSRPSQRPSSTAQAPSSPPSTQPETTIKTTTEPPKTTPYPISSETPMLLTVVEPSPETPMLIPVIEPSPPTLLADDMNKPVLLPEKPLFRPIVVPDERVPITTEEPEVPQQSADQYQENPAEVFKPASSDGILPPVTEQPEAQTTVRPITTEEVTTTPASLQESSSNPSSEVPDQEAQSQKIPPLFLGLLPPFPDPLEDGPSMPDEIPLLLDPVPMLPIDSATDPPITTYRPPFTTSVASTASPTTQRETTVPEEPVHTVRPTRAPELPETTQKITTIPSDIGVKTSPVADISEKESTQAETQPPKTEPTTSTAQPIKTKEPETPHDDDTDTAESDSSQLKGVPGTTIPPLTEEKPLPETTSFTETKKTTEADTTMAPSALPRTPSTPSTTRQPETDQPAELDISEELADSLSSVLSQVAEQPTTILIDPSTSDAILKVDDQKEDEPETESNVTPRVTEQPKVETTAAPTKKTPEHSTESDSATSAGTAVKTTLPESGGTHDTTTNVPADTTPSANKAPTNPEDHTANPSEGQPSLVTLNVADVTELKQPSTTSEQPDDRENKVTPRPVTVALVELAPLFKNPSSIQPPQLFRIASSTTTTTSTPEEEPSATDKTMHVLGSGEDEEFISNKEIEKDIEKETEDEKENDALVKRQEEAEAETQPSQEEATTEAKAPVMTTIPQKTEETFVATTTPKSSTPFKIVVQDSPIVYEDEDTFNSYTATPQSSSPSPFTATPAAPNTQPPSIDDATNPPTIPPAAQQTTASEATPEAVATTIKVKDEPVLITTPAIKLLPPESLNMGSDKEGTDMVNNSQEDEDVHSHKDSKPLSKIVPEDLPALLPAATAVPEVYKVQPTTIPPTQAPTEIPETTLSPKKAENQDLSPEVATDTYNTRYEESAITDPVPETPAPETPVEVVATTEKDLATTLVQESETTKNEDDTPKNEETTVAKAEETPQATDAPATVASEQPDKKTTPPAEESTDAAEEVAESTAFPILKKGVTPDATTLQDESTDAVETTLNPVKEDPTTQPPQETEAPVTEMQTPAKTDKPVDTAKPTVYNSPTEAETPSETEQPLATEAPAQTEAPAVTERVADETPAVTDKPAETEKPSEEETPAVTENSAATEVPAVTERTAETEKPEESVKPTATESPVENDKPVETEKPAQTEMPMETEKPAETEKPTEAQKPEDDDSVMMEPAVGTTTAPIASSNKPAVEEKLETSSSSPVLTKIGDPARPEVPEDPVVVLITKPPATNNFGVKDSAHDIRPTSRPRPPPAVQFQPLASTPAPLTRPPPPHHPSVQVTPAPQLRPGQFDEGPGANPSVSLDPAPGENLGLEVTTVSLGHDVRKFADLCNELAFRLWGAVTVRGLHSGRSVVMSPMGVTSTLAMVFLGARGPTSGQMNDILKLDDMVTFNPHQVFRNVTESVVLGRHPGIATAAFVRELYSDRSKGRLLDFYKERAQQFYDGHVEEVNFSVISDLVRRRTNMLVKRQTRGRVPEYLRGSHIQLHPPLAAFGANIFQTDCSAASTEGRDGEMYFTVLPGSRQRRLVLVPAAVWRSGFLAGYDPHLDCTAAAIGGAESLVSVVLLLPGQQSQLAPGDGVAALERRLTEPAYRRGAWARVLRSLLPRPGLELQLPRFSHRSLLNVTAALQRMGLRDLFSAEKADLRGLNGVANDLHLSDIVQVNTFSTCAEGTTGGRHHAEVYPSGGGGGGGRAGRGDLSGVPLALRPRQGREPEPAPAPAPRLRFDRPFIYAVRHNPTGFILHMGRFNPHLLH